MSQHTIFDDIVSGEIKSWIVWQNDSYMAFLTPFPSTPGATVVIPKQNIGADIFELSDQEYQDLLAVVKKVSLILKKAFNVDKVGLVFEGHIPHVHAKLYPFHGGMHEEPTEKVFYEKYPGFIDTRGGEKMPDEQLDAIQKQILEAGK